MVPCSFSHSTARPTRYRRLVALYRQGDLVCCLLYKLRGFRPPTCACRAFLVRIQLRRASSHFFTDIKTWISLCIGPTVVGALDLLWLIRDEPAVRP